MSARCSNRRAAGMSTHPFTASSWRRRLFQPRATPSHPPLQPCQTCCRRLARIEGPERSRALFREIDGYGRTVPCLCDTVHCNQTPLHPGAAILGLCSTFSGPRSYVDTGGVKVLHPARSVRGGALSSPAGIGSDDLAACGVRDIKFATPQFKSFDYRVADTQYYLWYSNNLR